jgi:K+-sensing histidine kinase KdpD
VGTSYASRTRAFAGDLTAALLAPVTALLSAELLHSVLGLTRIGVLFLAAVAVVASVRGRRAALLTALVSVLAYTLFLQVRIDEQTTAVEDLMNLPVFIVVALITGALAGKVHDEAAKAQRHARSMELLFRTSRTLSEEDEEHFWEAITGAMAQSSGGPALALDANGALRAQSGDPGSDPAAIAFGRQVLQCEAESDIVGEEEWRARTIPLEKPFAGVLLWNVRVDWEGSQEFVQLVVDLASASVARSRVRQEQSKIEAAREAEKLREAVLSSISHDFRSPLAAIIGSSTSLLEYGDKFDEVVRRDLLLNIQEEGEKLNRFVGNLLNMTRLQSGVVQPNMVTICVADIIAAAA